MSRSIMNSRTSHRKYLGLECTSRGKNSRRLTETLRSITIVISLAYKNLLKYASVELPVVLINNCMYNKTWMIRNRLLFHHNTIATTSFRENYHGFSSLNKVEVFKYVLETTSSSCTWCDRLTFWAWGKNLLDLPLHTRRDSMFEREVIQIETNPTK